MGCYLYDLLIIINLFEELEMVNVNYKLCVFVMECFVIV